MHVPLRAHMYAFMFVSGLMTYVTLVVVLIGSLFNMIRYVYLHDFLCYLLSFVLEADGQKTVNIVIYLQFRICL